MSLLITGASGFIGSRLLEAACKRFGADNVVALTSRGNELCRSVIYNQIDFRINSKDKNILELVDTIIHAGAYTPKSQEKANNSELCTRNIYFTEQLLSQELPNLKKIIYTSTLDVYQASPLITESTPTLPRNLYSLSKLYCEKLINIFGQERSISSNILRIGHIYGPGEEHYEKLIPTTIRRLLNGENAEVFGNGSAIRSFLYIDDAVDAIINAISHTDDLGVVNIASGKPTTTRQIIEALVKISGRDTNIVERDLKSESIDYIFDNKKMLRYLLPTETPLIKGLQIEYTHMRKLYEHNI